MMTRTGLRCRQNITVLRRRLPMAKTKLKDLMIQKTTAGTGSMILRHISLLPLSTKT
jgi:hypothetical protein